MRQQQKSNGDSCGVRVMLAPDPRIEGNKTIAGMSDQHPAGVIFRQPLEESAKCCEYLSSINPRDDAQLAYIQLKVNGRDTYGLPLQQLGTLFPETRRCILERKNVSDKRHSEFSLAMEQY